METDSEAGGWRRLTVSPQGLATSLRAGTACADKKVPHAAVTAREPSSSFLIGIGTGKDRLCLSLGSPFNHELTTKVIVSVLNTKARTRSWPRTPLVLSAEQERARDAFMLAWHEELPSKYAFVERFNHSALSELPASPAHFRTLEIGAGIGGHLAFEKLDRQEYHCLEYRAEFCERLRSLANVASVVQGSIEEQTPFELESLDRVVAIHVLEHLRNLPAALREIHRILKPGGIFDIVLPCEGGISYSFARKISSERMFRKRFKMDYMPIIRNEHVSTYAEVHEELVKSFCVKRTVNFPLPIYAPLVNIAIALRVTKI